MSQTWRGQTTGCAVYIINIMPITFRRKTCLECGNGEQGHWHRLAAHGAAAAMRQAATALGLGFRLRLLLIELPLAQTMILSGVKVAAVTSVGTATIAAFVGAGGFGERIAQGLALNNTSMLLAGAIPSAVLALLIQGGFFIFERRLANRRR